MYDTFNDIEQPKWWNLKPSTTLQITLSQIKWVNNIPSVQVVGNVPPVLPLIIPFSDLLLQQHRKSELKGLCIWNADPFVQLQIINQLLDHLVIHNQQSYIGGTEFSNYYDDILNPITPSSFVSVINPSLGLWIPVELMEKIQPLLLFKKRTSFIQLNTISDTVFLNIFQKARFLKDTFPYLDKSGKLSLAVPADFDQDKLTIWKLIGDIDGIIAHESQS